MEKVRRKALRVFGTRSSSSGPHSVRITSGDKLLPKPPSVRWHRSKAIPESENKFFRLYGLGPIQKAIDILIHTYNVQT